MNLNPSDIAKGGQDGNSFHVLSDDSFRKLQKQTISKPKKTKEDWRCLFALIILSGHFIIIGTIVVIWAFGRDIDDVIKILSTVGALLGSPLGFVIGYYYKDKSK